MGMGFSLFYSTLQCVSASILERFLFLESSLLRCMCTGRSKSLYLLACAWVYVFTPLYVLNICVMAMHFTTTPMDSTTVMAWIMTFESINYSVLKQLLTLSTLNGFAIYWILFGLLFSYVPTSKISVFSCTDWKERRKEQSFMSHSYQQDTSIDPSLCVVMV